MKITTKILVTFWLLWLPISIIEPGSHLAFTCNSFVSCIIANFVELGLFTCGVVIAVVLKGK